MKKGKCMFGTQVANASEIKPINYSNNSNSSVERENANDLKCDTISSKDKYIYIQETMEELDKQLENMTEEELDKQLENMNEEELKKLITELDSELNKNLEKLFNSFKLY